MRRVTEEEALELFQDDAETMEALELWAKQTMNQKENVSRIDKELIDRLVYLLFRADSQELEDDKEYNEDEMEWHA